MRDEGCREVYEVVILTYFVQNLWNDGFIANIEYSIEF